MQGYTLVQGPLKPEPLLLLQGYTLVLGPGPHGHPYPWSAPSLAGQTYFGAHGPHRVVLGATQSVGRSAQQALELCQEGRHTICYSPGCLDVDPDLGTHPDPGLVPEQQQQRQCGSVEVRGRERQQQTQQQQLGVGVVGARGLEGGEVSSGPGLMPAPDWADICALRRAAIDLLPQLRCWQVCQVRCVVRGAGGRGQGG